jgi:hypothetical protein
LFPLPARPLGQPLLVWLEAVVVSPPSCAEIAGACCSDMPQRKAKCFNCVGGCARGESRIGAIARGGGYSGCGGRKEL